MVERIRFSDSVLGTVGLGAFSGAGLVEGRWAAATSERPSSRAALAFIAVYFGRIAGVRTTGRLSRMPRRFHLRVCGFQRSGAGFYRAGFTCAAGEPQQVRVFLQNRGQNRSIVAGRLLQDFDGLAKQGL